MTKKTLITIVAVALVLVCAIGGTIAWLTDKTEKVVNTFTVGNIGIDLTETTGDEYKMIPGTVLTKDPTVKVDAKSEDCYLFVEITETAPKKADGTPLEFDTYLTYEVDEAWTDLPGVAGVYYQVVTASNADQTFAVLKNNEVKVNDTVTKADMDAISGEGATLPQLTFKAYAVQKENIASAELAWEKVG